MRVAKRAMKAGRFWLEAGTPLIKAEGVKAVAKLRKLFPDRFIVADLKTFDAGWVEVELAAKAGADLVTVMAAADDETIEDVVETAHGLGVKVMADLMSVSNPVKRAEEVEELGVDAVLLHVGYGRQRRGMTAAEIEDEVKQVVGLVKKPVAVAGGIKHGQVSRFLSLGCRIIIVGGAVTKASDPADAVKLLLEELAGKAQP